MNEAFVITGTDTDIGKTIFSAALTAALDGSYWKPVQAGLADGTDSETVARIEAITHDDIINAARTVYSGPYVLGLVGPFDEADFEEFVQ